MRACDLGGKDGKQQLATRLLDLYALLGVPIYALFVGASRAPLLGAAISRIESSSAWNVAMGVFIHRRLHLRPGLLASFKAMPRRKRAADCGF